MIPEQPLDSLSEAAECSYEIRAGSVDGPKTAVASVGDKLFHVWSCRTNMPGLAILVHSCETSDPGGRERVKILDNKGCVIDPILLSQVRYDGTRAWAQTHAYKYADESSVSFSCAIDMCPGLVDCDFVSPPQCGSAVVNPGGGSYGNSPSAVGSYGDSSNSYRGSPGTDASYSSAGSSGSAGSAGSAYGGVQKPAYGGQPVDSYSDFDRLIGPESYGRKPDSQPYDNQPKVDDSYSVQPTQAAVYGSSESREAHGGPQPSDSYKRSSAADVSYSGLKSGEVSYSRPGSSRPLPAPVNPVKPVSSYGTADSSPEQTYPSGVNPLLPTVTSSNSFGSVNVPPTRPNYVEVKPNYRSSEEKPLGRLTLDSFDGGTKYIEQQTTYIDPRKPAYIDPHASPQKPSLPPGAGYSARALGKVAGPRIRGTLGGFAPVKRERRAVERRSIGRTTRIDVISDELVVLDSEIVQQIRRRQPTALQEKEMEEDVVDGVVDGFKSTVVRDFHDQPPFSRVCVATPVFSALLTCCVLLTIALGSALSVVYFARESILKAWKKARKSRNMGEFNHWCNYQL